VGTGVKVGVGVGESVAVGVGVGVRVGVAGVGVGGTGFAEVISLKRTNPIAERISNASATVMSPLIREIAHRGSWRGGTSASAWAAPPTSEAPHIRHVVARLATREPQTGQ